MMEDPLYASARPDLMETSLGLQPQLSSRIGALVIFAANVEFRLERAIWRLQGHKPEGRRHPTDAKQIGQLIDMFEVEGARLTDTPESDLVRLWCLTARIAFEFRHSIAHGAAFRGAAAMNIYRNYSWSGEVRKRPAATLWGDETTFDSIYLTFALLLRVIESFSNDRRPMETIGTSERLSAMKRAHSLMEETASRHRLSNSDF